MNQVTQEIKSFFQLTQLPFGKEIDLQDMILHTTHQKIYQKLQLLVETKGIGMMTGRPGTGKSCIMRKLIKDLHPSLYKPIYVCHTSVGVAEFYSHICVALGIDPPGRKAKMFRAIKETIEQLNYSNRIHPVLIIDEAHLLHTEVLREIRLLTNFQVDSYNGLTVLLCGHEELHARFNLTMLEALASSITISITMEPLTPEETCGYIEHRVNTVRTLKEPLFTNAALKLIHESSGGNMRSINTIAGSSLFKAFHTKSQQIEKEHVTGVLQR